jgi:hypothetical protein
MCIWLNEKVIRMMKIRGKRMGMYWNVQRICLKDIKVRIQESKETDDMGRKSVDCIFTLIYLKLFLSCIGWDLFLFYML